VKYKHLKRVNHLNELKQKELNFDQKNKHIWKMCMPNEYELDYETVAVKKRPTMKIEQVEVDFLNSKMWLPGKTEWEPVELEFNGKPSDMLSRLIGNNTSTVKLTLMDETHQPLEEWTLFDAAILNMNDCDGITKVSITYHRAEYLPNYRPSITKIQVKNEK
jgi:hypothetical protein